MGAVAETAFVGNSSQRMIGVLEHGFCLPEPIVLNINKGRTVKKLLEITDVGGTGHTGNGVERLQLDFLAIVCMNVFNGFQQVEQITLSVLVGGLFLPDYIADLCDHIQCQVFLFLLGIVFLLFFKSSQFVKDADQIVVFRNIDVKKAVYKIVLISQHRVDIKQNMISG